MEVIQRGIKKIEQFNWKVNLRCTCSDALPPPPPTRLDIINQFVEKYTTDGKPWFEILEHKTYQSVDSQRNINKRNSRLLFSVSLNSKEHISSDCIWISNALVWLTEDLIEPLSNFRITKVNMYLVFGFEYMLSKTRHLHSAFHLIWSSFCFFLQNAHHDRYCLHSG